MFSLITDLLHNSSKLSTKDKDLIFEVVTNGINKTRAFISTNRVDNLDRPSNILSNVWQSAAVDLKRLNNTSLKPFIFTLYEKSKYWSDPDTYDKSQMEEYKMRLTEVEKSLNDLIK